MSSDLTAVPVAFPGATLTAGRDALLLRLAAPVRCLSSTVAGGGLGRVMAVASFRVDRNFNCADPARLARRLAATHGLSGRVACFLTALDLDRAALLEADEPRALVLVTAGTSNAATPGRSAVVSPGAGTINTLVLLDAALTPAALVATVQVATEAKTLALLEAGVRLADGDIATGTSTDAIAVCYTGRGARHAYAGSVTPIGHTVGRLVTAGVRDSLAGGNLPLGRTAREL